MASQAGKQAITISIYSISQEIKAMADNGIWSVNRIYQEKYFFKLYTENVVKKLVPEPFLKSQN